MKDVQNDVDISRTVKFCPDPKEESERFTKNSTKAAQLVVQALLRTIQLIATDKVTKDSLKIQWQQQRQVMGHKMEVQLRRLGPHNQITVLPLTNGDYTWIAGRGSKSDIYILSRYVSRTHFSVKYRNKNFYVYDHGSVNGTYINNKRMRPKQEYSLPLNSIISIGVTSYHQNDPDCIVFAFETCKERGSISKELQIEKKYENTETAVEDVDMESPPNETSLDKKNVEPEVRPVMGGQFHQIQNSANELDVEVVDIDPDKTEAEQTISDKLDNNVGLVKFKPEPICNKSVTNLLRMDKVEMIAAKEVECSNNGSFSETRNTATCAETDLFEPEGYADDEIVHAFEAQTQVDEPSTNNTELFYSMTEDCIEISDSEDDLIGNVKTEMGKVSFTNVELEDDDYDEDIICLEIIKSENKENFPPVEEIKIEDDDEFTETDIKWMGKLFKTKEKCCSFIQSQREIVESAKSGESGSTSMDLVTNCAEELQQIVITEDTEEDVLLKASESFQNTTATPKTSDIPLDVLNNDNSVVVGLLTLSQENHTAPKSLESSICKKKRSPGPANESNAEEKPKRIKLHDPFEFENEADILIPFTKRKKIHSSSAANSNYKITSLKDMQSKGRKSDLIDTAMKAPNVLKPFKRPGRNRRRTSKIDGMPTAEKIRIRDQRRKKLKELYSLRMAPIEGKKDEPRVDAPLKVKITRKNRNEYLCEQIGNQKLTLSNSKTRSVAPAKLPEVRNRTSEEEKAETNRNITVEERSNQMEIDFSQRVPQVYSGEMEGKEVIKEKVLSNSSASCQLVNYPNVNIIAVQNERRGLKSCLKKFGSGFMRNKRPMVPLKSVSFDTTRNIKFYETETNISRRISSFHTNNRPKLAGENRLLRQKFALIVEVCKWNAAWLEECKRVPLHELPLAFRLDKLKSVTNSFSNHDSYEETFIPLILIELLYSIIERWKNRTNSMYRFPAELKRYAEDLGALGDGLGRLQCESVMEVSTAVPFLVREGDLVMISLTKPSVNNEKNKSDAKKMVWMILGYVERVVMARADPEKIKSTSDGKCPVSKSAMVLSLEILVAKLRELYTKSGTIIQITGAYHATHNFNMCQAVSMLAKSPLCQTILSPNRLAMALSSSPCNEAIIFNGPLDDMQRELVLKLVSSCLNRDHGLLQFQGGPGTGKTHVIIAFILQILFTKQWKGGARPIILYCTHSNVAVDHTTLKLKNYRQSMSKESRFKLARFGRTSSIRPDVRDVSTCSLGLRNDQIILENKVKALNEKINVLVADLEASNGLNKAEIDEKSSKLHACVKEREMLKNSKSICIPGKKPTYESECSVIENADVICTTIGSIGAKMMLNAFEKIRERDPKRKIICIVDEAMQSKESETIIPLLLGVTHLILGGDSRQLKGSVRCQVAQRRGLHQSLFWRVLSVFRDPKEEALSPVFTLRNQYRMNSAISAFPIKHFYPGSMRDCIKDKRSYDIQDYVVLIDNVTPESSMTECETRLSEIAVNLASEMLNTMADDIPDNNFEVITCTVEHSKTLKAILSEKVDAKALPKMDVNPIESVQGQEFDIVLVIIQPNMVSATRANMAMTRAKHSLIILITNPVYKYNKFLCRLAEDACVRGVSSYVAPHMEGPVLRRLVSKMSAALQ